MIHWMTLLAVSAGVAGVTAVAASTWVARNTSRTEKRLLGALSEIENDIRVVGLSLGDAGHRVEQVEDRLHTLKRAQHSLESRATGSSNYAQAISLVRRGWRMEDLMNTCGLTRGEAELVYLLHGPSAAEPSRNAPSKNQ